MELWQEMVRQSVHSVDQLVEKFGLDREVAKKLDVFFQARINPTRAPPREVTVLRTARLLGLRRPMKRSTST